MSERVHCHLPGGSEALCGVPVDECDCQSIELFLGYDDETRCAVCDERLSRIEGYNRGS